MVELRVAVTAACWVVVRVATTAACWVVRMAPMKVV